MTYRNTKVEPIRNEVITVLASRYRLRKRYYRYSRRVGIACTIPGVAAVKMVYRQDDDRYIITSHISFITIRSGSLASTTFSKLIKGVSIDDLNGLIIEKDVYGDYTCWERGLDRNELD